jgi:hypothetical protein
MAADDRDPTRVHVLFRVLAAILGAFMFASGLGGTLLAIIAFRDGGIASNDVPLVLVMLGTIPFGLLLLWVARRRPRRGVPDSPPG